MRTATCLLAALALACGRDLAVPAARAAPRIDSLSHAAADPGGLEIDAFAGEPLYVHGANLSGASRVSFGALAGQVASVSADGTLLVVTVPEDAAHGPVTVATPQGTASAGTFSYRGLGHPNAAYPRARNPLGPKVRLAVPLSDRFAVLDSRHGSFEILDDRGNPDLAPMPCGSPDFAFAGAGGNDLWVHDANDVSLRHFKLTSPPSESADKVPLRLPGDGSPISDARALSANDGGTLAALSDRRGNLLVFDLGTGAARVFPVFTTLTDLDFTAFMGSAVVGFGGGVFFRVELTSGAISVGAALDPAAAPDPSSPAALTAVSNQLAYLRHDGAIGFADVSGAAEPKLSATLVLPQVGRPGMLTWAADGNTLLVGDRFSGSIVSIDMTPGTNPTFGKAVGTHVLPGLASLMPIRAGIAKGLILAGAPSVDGIAVLLPTAQPVRTHTVLADLQDVAATTGGNVIIRSAFGTLLARPASSDREPVGTDVAISGLGQGEGGLAGWEGDALYVLDPTQTAHWARIGTAGGPVNDIALSPDGASVALTVANANGSLDLQLLPLPGKSGAAARVPLSAGDARLAWFRNVLYASRASGQGFSLVRFGPGLVEQASVALPGAARRLWAAPALGGVVAYAPDVSDPAFNAGALSLWQEGAGALLTDGVPDGFPEAVAASADGRVVVCRGDPSLATNTGFDLVRLDLLDGHLSAKGSLHVELDAPPSAFAPSSDGARFFATQPGTNQLIVLE